MSNKTILVAGGAGYIGASLCRKLLAAGENVICLDNLEMNKKINILDLMGNSAFKILDFDIMSPLADSLLVNIKVDEIYDLTSPPPAFDPKESMPLVKKSIMSAFNLLELTRRCKCKILHAVISETYEDFVIRTQLPANNCYVNCCIGSRNSYSERDVYTESIFFDYQVEYNLPVKIVHVFNTYGPHLHPGDGRIISILICQALLQNDIVLYGNGNQKRSFCFVDDLSDGLISMMKTNDEVTGPVPLGNPREFTILELASLIIKETCSKSKLIYKALPIDEPKQVRPDISYARNALGWEPKTGLEEGLRLTIRYYNTLLNNNTFFAELNQEIA